MLTWVSALLGCLKFLHNYLRGRSQKIPPILVYRGG